MPPQELLVAGAFGGGRAWGGLGAGLGAGRPALGGSGMGFMIMGQNGRYLPRTTHDHGPGADWAGEGGG